MLSGYAKHWNSGQETVAVGKRVDVSLPEQKQTKKALV